MKLPALLLVLFLSPLTGAQTTVDDLYEPVPFKRLPPAANIMAEVRARLPQEALTMQVDLQSYDKGKRTTQLKAEMTFDWRPPAPSAAYRIFDRFGDLRERVAVQWLPGRPARFTHFAGENTTPTPAFSPARTVESLALSWNDLSLSFLWWNGGKTTGWETRRGRDCWIVEMAVPPESGMSGDRLRLWIDESQYVLFRADLIAGPEEKLVTRIDADKLGKFDGLWMVKDLEIVHPAEHKRTRIRVREVVREKAIPETEAPDE